jgi:hypothetical protein
MLDHAFLLSIAGCQACFKDHIRGWGHRTSNDPCNHKGASRPEISHLLAQTRDIPDHAREGRATTGMAVPTVSSGATHALLPPAMREAGDPLHRSPHSPLPRSLGPPWLGAAPKYAEGAAQRRRCTFDYKPLPSYLALFDARRHVFRQLKSGSFPLLIAISPPLIEAVVVVPESQSQSEAGRESA